MLLGVYIYFYSIQSVVVEKIKKFFCFFLGIPNIVSFSSFIILIILARQETPFSIFPIITGMDGNTATARHTVYIPLKCILIALK